MEVTLHVDSSEMMTMEVYFPTVDFTVKKELNLGKRESATEAIQWVKDEIHTAERALSELKDSGLSVDELEKELSSVKELLANGQDPMRTLSNLKELLRKIENLEDSSEWDRIEKELRTEFERLEVAQSELGDEKSGEVVKELHRQVDNVIRTQDVALGRSVLEQVVRLFVHLTMVYQCMAIIKDCEARFDQIAWRDRSRARQLINQGLSEMNDQPSTERLHPIAVALIDLMPSEEATNAGGLLK